MMAPNKLTDEAIVGVGHPSLKSGKQGSPLHPDFLERIEKGLSLGRVLSSGNPEVGWDRFAFFWRGKERAATDECLQSSGDDATWGSVST